MDKSTIFVDIMPHPWYTIRKDGADFMRETRKKEDRRVVRTKKAIRSAFTQLITEKAFEDITVTDIAQTADINRKTFYNYYHNTQDLLEDFEGELITSFDHLLDDLKASNIISDPSLVVGRISKAVEEKLDLFRDLLLMSKNTAFFGRIADNLMRQMRGVLESQDYMDPLQAEILSVFLMSGTLAVYRNWLDHGSVAHKEALDGMVTRLSIAAISEALEGANRK